MQFNTNFLASVLLAFIVLPNFLSVTTNAQTFSDDEVQRFYAGDTIMYRYKDEHGKVVIQDTPPPGYIDPNLEHNTVIETESNTPTQPVAVKTVTLVKTNPKWLPLSLWLCSALLFLGSLVLIVQPRVKRYRSETPLDRSLRRANYLSFNDIAVKDPSLGQAEVDRIVRTPSGFLVLIISHLNGKITGQPDQKEWRLSRTSDVSMVVNPLYRLDQGLKIVKQVLGNAPVFGRVVETGKTTYANAMPSTVQKFSVFKQALPTFAEQPANPNDLDAAWRLLMRFSRSNQVSVRYYRAGLVGWVQKHSRSIAAAGLVLMGIAVAAFNHFVIS